MIFFQKKRKKAPKYIDKYEYTYTVDGLKMTKAEWEMFCNKTNLVRLCDCYLSDVSPFLVKVEKENFYEYDIFCCIKSENLDKIDCLPLELCHLYDYNFISNGTHGILSKENSNKILEDIKIIKPAYKLKGETTESYFFKFKDKYVESNTPNYYKFLYDKGYRDDNLYELIPATQLKSSE